MQLTFTLDLENHRANASGEPRYRDNARRILSLYAAHGIRATIFIVGELIAAERALIAEASAAGHEFALHSFRHTPLTGEDPQRYAARLRGARDALEDASGQPVHGYRAPVFSLTPAAQWVLPVLAELGFRYSSSVLPARHPLYGFRGAPRTAFRWPQGLLEFPVPLARIAGLTLPFLGGIYLRYLPRVVIDRELARLPAAPPLWTYLHPYDVDAREPYFRFPGTSLPMSLLLWRNRGGTLGKLEYLAHRLAPAPPFGERIRRGEFAALPVWQPVPAANAGASQG